MTEKAPEPLPTSIVQAHVVLVNEVYGGFQADPETAQRLHPDSWQELYRPEYAINPSAILADAQISSIFVDQVQNSLDQLDAIEREIVSLRLGLDYNGEITSFKASGSNIEQYLGGHVSRERVRQIYLTALRRLRKPSVAGNLPAYLPAQHPAARANIR